MYNFTDNMLYTYDYNGDGGNYIMDKEVMLRKSGNSLILTAPADLSDSIGKRYTVTQNDDGTIVYTPVKHVNIFTSPELKDYDFRADLRNIPEAAELKPVGKEKL